MPDRYDRADGPSLTEAEADLIAKKLEARLVERFHLNLGRGVWGMAWKAVLVVIVAVALYGSIKTGVRPF